MEPVDLVRKTEAAARAGDAQAQYEFATMLRVGKLVERDLYQSRAWYAKAAAQGDPEAQNDFGSMLHNGMGGDEDGASAAVWYLRAAEGGCAEAQFNMAQRYLHGDFVEANDERAAFWGAQAAANGHPQGSTLLGNCYRFGRGVEVDLIHAARLYVIGARGSDPVAHGNLADCREELEAPALTGSTVAALMIATLYIGGLGGERDRPLSKAWLDLLDELGRLSLDSEDYETRHKLHKILDDVLDDEGLRQSEQNLQELRRRRVQLASSPA